MRNFSQDEIKFWRDARARVFEEIRSLFPIFTSFPLLELVAEAERRYISFKTTYNMPPPLPIFSPPSPPLYYDWGLFTMVINVQIFRSESLYSRNHPRGPPFDDLTTEADAEATFCWHRAIIASA